MGIFLAVLGIAVGILIVLIGNPVQLMPRFMHPIRYVAVTRAYDRWRVEYSFKRPFFMLSHSAAAVLLLWFFVGMMAPLNEDLALSRIVLGLGVGGFLGWYLFCRREVLFGKPGAIGFYPNPRLVVAWKALGGYALSERAPRALILVDRVGNPVEAIPIVNDLEQREMELALLPYLPRLDMAEVKQQALPKNVRRALQMRYVLLLAGSLPLVGCLIFRFVLHQEVPNIVLAVATTAAVLVPFAVFNWSQQFRLLYYSSHGHVKLAQLVSLCTRCYYQSVCWQSGLHRRIRWQQGRVAIAPSWEEFSKGFRHKPKITAEIYNTCCRCLVSHLQAQDLYHVNLVPLYPTRPPAVRSQTQEKKEGQ